MVPAGSQKAHLEQFFALGAQWSQEALKRLIWNIFWPWAPNSPRDYQEAHLEHFLTLGAEWFQQALRMLIWSISWPWAPNCSRRFFLASGAKRARGF